MKSKESNIFERRLLPGLGAALIPICCLVGCTRKIEFDEEILLPGGRKVSVHRQVTLERVGEFGGGSGYMQSFSRITMQSSSASKPITWESTMRPVLIAQHAQDSNFVIVALPGTCDDYRRLGRPIPPYVEFRFIENQWQSFHLSPSLIGLRTNLLLEVEEIESSSSVDLAQKDRIAGSGKQIPKHLQTVDREYKLMCGQ